ncbi:1907_t:CDS:2, partial [Gigaspora margarita]
KGSPQQDKQCVKEGYPPQLYQASTTENRKTSGVNYNEKGSPQQDKQCVKEGYPPQLYQASATENRKTSETRAEDYTTMRKVHSNQMNNASKRVSYTSRHKQQPQESLDINDLAKPYGMSDIVGRQK